jgi:hypothetical protein
MYLADIRLLDAVCKDLYAKRILQTYVIHHESVWLPLVSRKPRAANKRMRLWTLQTLRRERSRIVRKITRRLVAVSSINASHMSVVLRVVRMHIPGLLSSPVQTDDLINRRYPMLSFVIDHLI